MVSNSGVKHCGSFSNQGLVKMIKNYNKQPGALVFLPFIQEFLHQPFFKTDVLDKLIKECEVLPSKLIPRTRPSGSSAFPSISVSEEDSYCSLIRNENKENLEQVIKHMENMYTKLTLSTLNTLEEIRKLLAYFHCLFCMARLWKKLTALEQEA